MRALPKYTLLRCYIPRRHSSHLWQCDWSRDQCQHLQHFLYREIGGCHKQFTLEIYHNVNLLLKRGDWCPFLVLKFLYHVDIFLEIGKIIKIFGIGVSSWNANGLDLESPCNLFLFNKSCLFSLRDTRVFVSSYGKLWTHFLCNKFLFWTQRAKALATRSFLNA